MTPTPYLERRGSVFRVRFRVPRDLVDRLGIAEIRRSLQTGNLLEAERRALAARIWFTDVVAMLRAMDAPSRADLERAARAFFERLKRLVDQPRSFNAETWDQEIDWNVQETRTRIQELDDQLRTNKFGPGVEANAAEMLRILSLTLPKLADDMQRLSMQLAARAEREQMRYFEHQLSTPFTPFEAEDGVFRFQDIASDPSALGYEPSQHSLVNLHKATEEYLQAKRRRGLGQSQVDETARALSWLQEEVGEDTPLVAVRKEQLRRFRDDLERIDVTLRGRELPFQERLTNKEADRIKSVTSSRYWRSVAGFFAWAAAEGLVGSNPAAGLRLEPRKGEPKKTPAPFSEAELRKLFRTPLYAGYKSPKRVNEEGSLLRRDGHWWSGVLPLFTGIRAGELSQLLPSDFVFDDPIPHLKIREEDGAGQLTKRAKTASSIRDVPLLPILLQLGLREFVQARAKLQPKGRIFREFRLGGGDRLSDGMTKFWLRTLQKWGLHTPGRATHVSRHTFVAALRKNGVLEDEIGALVGHAPKSITGSYGGAFPLSRKLNAIGQIDYGFDVMKALGGPYQPSLHGLMPD